MSRRARRTLLGAGAAPSAYTPPVAGPLLWFEASSESYANGDPVSSATDRSGNAHDATQASGPARPAFVTNVLSGLPVYRFDADDLLHTTNFALAQPLNVFFVAKAANGASQYLCDGNGGNQLVVMKASDDSLRAYGGGFIVGPALDAGFHILQVTFAGGSSVARIDGGAGTTGDTGTSSVSGFTLGAYGGAAAFLQGDIAEALVYGALTLVQVNAIGSYLGGKYGLAWTTAT